MATVFKKKIIICEVYIIYSIQRKKIKHSTTTPQEYMIKQLDRWESWERKKEENARSEKYSYKKNGYLPLLFPLLKLAIE